MLDDRNNTSHTYDEDLARNILKNIKLYLPIFEQTYQTLKAKYHS